jgi:hypothetical protein
LETDAGANAVTCFSMSAPALRFGAQTGLVAQTRMVLGTVDGFGKKVHGELLSVLVGIGEMVRGWISRWTDPPPNEKG